MSDINATATMQAVRNWQAAKAAMELAIANEIAARRTLIAYAFPKPVEGTNDAPIGDGTVLKGLFRNNYKLDKTTVEAQLKLLPSAVRGGLVSWSPNLSISAYKALEPAHRKIINESLTISPGTPSLEIVQPKARP